MDLYAPPENRRSVQYPAIGHSVADNREIQRAWKRRQGFSRSGIYDLPIWYQCHSQTVRNYQTPYVAYGKAKKTTKKSINYLTVDGIQLLLQQPDQSTQKGRRDLAMLSLMYDCAARVQEIIDLTPAMIRLTKPYTVKIIGKGNKPRIVPLMEQQVFHLKRYLAENRLLENHNNFHPLFFNNRNEKLTRQGVANILQTYARTARDKDSTLIPKLSPHCIRHSKAMHLLQAGVNLVYIRDILGHESVLTTEIYARADSKQKREAIENAYVNVVNKESPIWIENDNLLTWLKDFK